ncbi:MAG: hypothetical protein OEZ01_00290 [Candidatus Heimdallarchaeota archaeon]|nr:hypothetical protein [Candidatus Heimdallarchaeota archaeon]
MTNNYTAWKKQDVNEFVSRHLNSIVKEIREVMGHRLEAIVLGGGFGRSEGSVFIALNGEKHVVNDYDIEVVYKSVINSKIDKLFMYLFFRNKLETLAQELSGRMQIKQIDLGLRSVESYKNIVVPRLADYDIKYGHKLLYGREDPVSVMKSFSSQDIPVFEGAWLLRNRGIGLILAKMYLSDGKIIKDKEEYFYVEIIKAIIAMGDSIFILNGKYVCSYEKRALQVDQFIATGPDWMAQLTDLYREAVEEKLRPRNKLFREEDPSVLWESISDLFQKLFLFYESKRLREPIGTLKEYYDKMLFRQQLNNIQRVRMVIELLFSYHGVRRNISLYRLRHDKQQNILFVLLLLATGTTGSKHQKKPYIELLAKILKKNKLDNKNEWWKNLSTDFLILIHAGGEVGRFLRAKGPTADQAAG